MHRIKLILIFSLLHAGFFLFANGENPLTLRTFNTFESIDETCSLPAPAGFHVTNVTSNSISVQWLPVSGAVSYMVQAFDSITNIAVGLPLITTNTNATVTGLTPGTSYLIEVGAMCSPVLVSANRSSLFQRTNIIIDLIVNGYNCNRPQGGWSSHNFNGSSFFEYVFLNTVYVIEIRKTNSGGELISRLDFKIVDGNAGFYIVSSNAGNFNDMGQDGKFTIPGNQPDLCTFHFDAVNTAQAKLSILSPQDNSPYSFWIARCTDSNNGLKSQLEVRSDQTTEATPLRLAPNPFSGYLEVQFPDDEEDSPATVQLFHSNGALALSQKMASARGKTLTMNTSGLPAGMYLLRTETLTGVTTKLVMKAE